jgi:hypothetical protein
VDEYKPLPAGVDALDATHVHIGGFYVCKGMHKVRWCRLTI